MNSADGLSAAEIDLLSHELKAIRLGSELSRLKASQLELEAEQLRVTDKLRACLLPKGHTRLLSQDLSEASRALLSDLNAARLSKSPSEAIQAAERAYRRSIERAYRDHERQRRSTKGTKI